MKLLREKGQKKIFVFWPNMINPCQDYTSAPDALGSGGKYPL